MKGFALLSALFAITIISLLAWSGAFFVSSIMKARQIQVLSEIAKEEAEAKVIELSEALSPLSHQPRVEAAAQHGTIEITRQLCTHLSPPLHSLLNKSIIDGTQMLAGETFPLFDYNSLFSSVSPCSYQTIASTQTTHLGFPISPSASLSKRLCLHPSPFPNTHNAFVGNISVEQSISLGIQGSRSELAATGYIDLTEEIEAMGNTLIVAGGDLHIKRLNASLNQGIQITLISATGVVWVDEIVGAPALKAIAWLGVFLPAGSIGGSSHILPPILEGQLLGFTDAR